MSQIDSEALGAARVYEFALEHAPALRLPVCFVELLLLIEDKRFPTHFGIDPIAMLRAFRCNLLSIGMRQGASTLTQQIYNVRVMARERKYQRTAFRKIAQLAFALTKGQRISKVAIVREYTDGVYWGRNLWGLDAAASWYFGKDREHLNVEECFFLIERLACPNRISRRRVEVILRRKTVNQALRRGGSSANEVIGFYLNLYGTF
jgi:membrane peptidoglycan carboxypeptidase